MNDVVIAWKKGIWGKNRMYPEIDSKVFLGLICLFDTDKNEQIFVHREGEKIYYVYLWKLSKFDYISLGLLTNKLCLDYYDLLRTFRAFVKDMAVNELCVHNTIRGKIKLSSHNIQKQPRQRTLLDINIKNLKSQFDEKQKKWSNLPSQKLGILKSDIVPCTLEIQGSSWIVTQVTSGYRNVCISIRDENRPLNKDGRSKESGIVSIINSLQILPKSSNSWKTAKTLKSLCTTNESKGKKKEKKYLDWSELFAACVFGGGIISVLLSCIAPWFISTMQIWLKFALVLLSCLGVYLIIYATNDNHKGKNIPLAGWSGAIAILLSTILTIYELCGGFSPDKVDEGGKVQTDKNFNDVPKEVVKEFVSKPALCTSNTNRKKEKVVKESVIQTDTLIHTQQGKSDTSSKIKSMDLASHNENKDVKPTNANSLSAKGSKKEKEGSTIPQKQTSAPKKESKQSTSQKSNHNKPNNPRHALKKTGQFDNVEWSDN